MLTVCQSNTTPGKLVLWEFRGLTPYVQAGLVPVPCGATTRVARTPQNPQRTYFLPLNRNETHPLAICYGRSPDRATQVSFGRLLSRCLSLSKATRGFDKLSPREH